MIAIWRKALQHLQGLHGFWGAWNDLFQKGGSSPRARVYKKIARLSFHAAFAVLIVWVIKDSPDPHSANWVVGDAASDDIKSPITATITLSRGQLAREELIRRIPPVFDYDDQIVNSWLGKWDKAFRTIREEYYKGKNEPPSLSAVSDRIYQLTGNRVSGRDLTFLHRNRFSQSIERSFLRLGEHLSRRIISPSNIFPLYYNTGIYVRLTNQSMREVIINDISRIWSLEQAQDFLSQIARSGKALQIDSAQVLVDLINPILPVNLTFNQAATQKRFNEALSNARQTQIPLKKGQVIVKRGELVSDTQAEVLSEIDKRLSPIATFRASLCLLVLLIIVISCTLRVEFSPQSLWNSGLKDVSFFAAILFAELLIFRLTQTWCDALKPFSAMANPVFLFPVATGPIVINLMLGREASHLFSLLLCLCLGYRLDGDLSYSLFVLVTSWTAILTIRSCRERNDLYKCGLWSAGVGATICGTLLFQEALDQLTITDTLLALAYPLVSGVLSAALASSLIPPLESVFGYTTSLKLLELSNFNHPLLHALMLKAPGTYHHSIIVGSLAEIAADKSGANALLARVSAYYHDIGKMNKPLYFIENQSPAHNPHDTLLPSLSAKILFSHVKDGSRLAREYKLGDLITNIIDEHHGTTLVNYFFNKAKKTEEPQMETVDEAGFRYPGPKPQTKEAAIVMICDACEAATRSISDPTAAKIQSMVHSIIQKRYLEGQFDECNLLTSDLKAIESAVARTLQSLYHHRIEYPGQKDQMAASQPKL